MAAGIFLLDVVLEASTVVRVYSLGPGDGIGEKDLSENVVVEDVGEFAPQPKNEPSLEPPGDFGCCFCIVVLDSFESFE